MSPPGPQLGGGDETRPRGPLTHHSGRKPDPLRRQRLGDLRRDLGRLLLGRQRGRGRRRGVGVGVLTLGGLGGLRLALEEVEDAELGGLRRLRGRQLLGGGGGGALLRRHGDWRLGLRLGDWRGECDAGGRRPPPRRNGEIGLGREGE